MTDTKLSKTGIAADLVGIIAEHLDNDALRDTAKELKEQNDREARLEYEQMLQEMGVKANPNNN